MCLIYSKWLNHPYGAAINELNFGKEIIILAVLNVENSLYVSSRVAAAGSMEM